MADYTWFDFIIFLVFFLAVVLGLARGLMREIISLLIVIVGLIVTIKFALPLAQFLYYTKGSHDVIAFISRYIAANNWDKYIAFFTLDLSVLLLFVGTTSIVEAVNHYVFPNAFMGAALSFLYRITGGIVGLIRGYIYNVILILILSITPLTQDPAWTGSYFVHRLSASVNILGSLIQPGGYGNFSSIK